MTRAADRTKPAPADPHIDALLKRLDDLAKRSPDLAEPIAFYRQALPALRRAQAGVEPFALEAGLAARKLHQGQPLLVGEDLPLDLDATRELFLTLCRMAERLTPAGAPSSRSIWDLFRHGKPDSLKLMESARSGDSATLRAVAAGQIRQAVEQGQLDLVEVLAALGLGDWPRLERVASGLQLDPDFLRLLAQSSLKPSLRVWAQGLRPRDLDDWRRGQCPVCGSPPLLAEIQGKEGERRLRCGACGVSWHYARLKCVFCGNGDFKLLGYIGVDGEEEKYRLQTCDGCRSYIKVVVTFDPIPVDLLLVEDLATLHLDFVAVERGFNRGSVQ
jgi:FdhE protein